MDTQIEWTPNELARAWRVRPAKVYAWLNRGELQGEDLSDRPGVTRPRWRITAEAAQAFREARRNRPRPVTSSRRRRKNRKL